MMKDMSTTLSLRSAPSCSSPRPFHSHADVLQRPNRPVLRKQGPQHTFKKRSAVLVQAAFGSKTATKATYVCIDCGWVYDERAAFDSLPSSYRCPVCSAPKRRFKKQAPGGGKGGSRKGASPKSFSSKDVVDAGDQQPYLLAAVGGVVFLAAVYAVLNAAY